MSSNNNSSPEAIIGFIAIGFFILVLQVIAWIIFLGTVAITAYMTVVALMCWKTPRIIHGELVTPEEAQGFIIRGLLGIFVAFVLTQLYCAIEHTYFSENMTALMMFGGYVVGSVGIGMAIAEYEQEQAKAQAEQASRMEILPPAPPPIPQQQSFHFASWDDEERL